MQYTNVGGSQPDETFSCDVFEEAARADAQRDLVLRDDPWPERVVVLFGVCDECVLLSDHEQTQRTCCPVWVDDPPRQVLCPRVSGSTEIRRSSIAPSALSELCRYSADFPCDLSFVRDTGYRDQWNVRVASEFGAWVVDAGSAYGLEVPPWAEVGTLRRAQRVAAGFGPLFVARRLRDDMARCGWPLGVANTVVCQLEAMRRARTPMIPRRKGHSRRARVVGATRPNEMLVSRGSHVSVQPVDGRVRRLRTDEYSPALFRKWVQARAYQLAQRSPRGTVFLLSQAYAHLLHQRPHCSRPHLAHLLAKADVFAVPAREDASQPVSGFVAVLCGEVCRSSRAAAAHRECYRRQRPTFTTLLATWGCNLDRFSRVADALWRRGPPRRCIRRCIDCDVFDVTCCRYHQPAGREALVRAVAASNAWYRGVATPGFKHALRVRRAAVLGDRTCVRYPRFLPLEYHVEAWRDGIRLFSERRFWFELNLALEWWHRLRNVAGRRPSSCARFSRLCQLNAASARWLCLRLADHAGGLVDATERGAVAPEVSMALMLEVHHRLVACGWSEEALGELYHPHRLIPCVEQAIELYRRRHPAPPALTRVRADSSEMRLEGGALSVGIRQDQPIVHEHLHRVAPEDLESLRGLLSEATALLPPQFARVAMQAIVLVAQISRSSSFGDAVLAAMQFSLGVDWLWSMLGVRLMRLQEAGMAMLRFESGAFGNVPAFERVARLARELWECVMACVLAPFFRTIFGGAWDLVSCELPRLLAEIKLAVLKDTAKSIGGQIVAVASEVLLRLKLAVTKRSWAPLFGPRWDSSLWARDVHGLVQHYPTITCRQGADAGDIESVEALRKRGDVPSFVVGRMTLVRYREVLLGYEETGKAMMKATPTAVAAKELEVGLRALRHQLQTVANVEYASAERPTPFCVLLFGKPGTGKTFISRLIGESIGRIHGYEHGPTGRYQWRVGVNFQDGLTHIPWHILVDDVDQTVAKDTPTVMNHVQLMIDLVNNKPMPVEQAAVELKGRINSAPSLVTWCTNFAACNLTGHCLEPEAFWRRLDVYAEVRVRPEFVVPGTTQLDKARATDAGTSDVYLIDVYRRVPLSSDPFRPPFEVSETMSLRDFLVLVNRGYKEHLVQQLRALATPADKGFCATCGQLLSAACGCPHASREDSVPEGPQPSEEPVGGVPRASLPDDVVSLVISWVTALRGLGQQHVPILGWFFRWFYGLNPKIGDDDEPTTGDVFATAALVITALGACMWCIRVSRLFTYEMREGMSADAIPKEWVPADVNFTPGMPVPHLKDTYTKEQLLSAVHQSMGFLTVPGRGTCHAVVLSAGVIIIPTHCLQPGDEGELELGAQKHRVVHSLCSTSVCSLNRELMVVSVPSVGGYKGILPYVPVAVDEALRVIDELEVISSKEVRAIKLTGARYVQLEEGRCVQADFQSQKGDCGSLYIGRQGSSWRVVAVHFGSRAHVVRGRYAFGAVVTRLDLERAAMRIATSLDMVYTPKDQLSREGGEPLFNGLPANSEVRDALGRGAFVRPIGELSPRPPGATTKSRVRRTQHAYVFEALEARECGARDYWGPPRFKGCMEDGQWRSPYQDALLAGIDAIPDELVLWYAFMDYISGAEKLNREGYRFLSENEAIVGVPGAWVNPLNGKTSTGPPHLQKKHLHFARVDGCGWSSPQMVALRASIIACLDAETVPAPVGRCVLKDEPVKPGKRARVFTCLPIAFNILLKQHLSPVLIFMRSNVGFFESFVGVDMTSSDCERYIQHMQSMGEGRRNITERDVRKMDKSYTAIVLKMWCHFVFAMCHLLGVDAWRAYRLARGDAHTRFEIKGDLFEANWNASGSFGTIEKNGFNTSLGSRYEYYWIRRTEVYSSRDEILSYIATFFENPVPPVLAYTFRQDVALATFGDDQTGAHRTEPRYDDAVWRSHLGMEITDGAKMGATAVKTLEEITFLKRTPRFHPGAGRMVMALDRRSIVRMCVVRMDADVSDVDHAALTLSTALREAAAHGEDFYVELRDLVEIAARQFHYHDSPHYRSPPYREMVELMARPDFSAFVSDAMIASDFVPFLRREPDFQAETKFSYEMEQENIATSSATGAAQVVEQSGEMDCCDVHPLGAVEPIGDHSELAIPEASRLYQRMPKADLGDYLERMTLIQSIALTAAGGYPEEVTSITPYFTFMQNAAIKKKMDTYKLFRADLELEIVSVFPSGTYGLFQLSFLPTAESSTSTTSSSLLPRNCRQVDISVEIDPRRSATTKLTLPFTYWYDYAPIGAYNWWVGSLVRLAPLQTSIPGGVATGYVRIFARFKPGWDMVVPRLEMGDLRLEGGPSGARSGAVSGVAAKVASAAAILKDVPVIGSVAQSVGGVASVVRDVAAFFGFSREMVEQQPMPMMAKGLANLARTDVRDNGDVLTCVGNGAISVDGGLMDVAGQEHADFASLFKRPTLITEATITAALASGVVLLSLPVVPGLCTSPAADRLAFSPMGFAGLPFEFWRGDINFHVRIVAGTVHGGAIQVLWLPDGSDVGGPDPTNMVRNAIIDLASCDEHIFTVGFARREPYISNPVHVVNVTTGTSGNGTFIVRLLTPLQTQNAANTAVVLVWVSGGPNLDFRLPRTRLTVPVGGTPTNVAFAGSIRLEAGDDMGGGLGAETRSAPCVYELVPSSGEYPTDEVIMPGLGFRSARAAVQKPSLSVFTQLNSAAPYTDFLARPLGTSMWSTPAPRSFAWDQYYASLFVGIAGSRKFQLVSKDSCSYSAFFSSDDTWPPHTSFQQTAMTNSYSVTFPYWAVAKMYPAQPPDWMISPTARIRAENNGAGSTKVNVYSYMGDDVRFARFRQVPLVRIEPTPTASNPATNWFVEVT